MGGDCKIPKGFSDGATRDERMLQGCMQLSGVAIFYPRDASQRVENPSIDGCQLPLSSASYCNYALTIALPRLRVHTVRMESGSCDRVAFGIDDPA